MDLLFENYVHKIHINEINQSIYSFWKSVLNDTDAMCRLIKDTPLSVAAWDEQKKIFSNGSDYSYLALGFATLYLNRTNRSGILNAGIIGGRGQSGKWKMDARYNASELIFRIQSIAKMRNRIKLTRSDAIAMMRFGLRKWTSKTLIYVDPPYYKQGKRLYYNFYNSSDHMHLYKFIAAEMNERYWVVSYDSVEPIKKLYTKFRDVMFDINYSAHETRIGKEVMFFSDNINIPESLYPVDRFRTINNTA